MAKTEKQYITISFDASREPLDELFWCEAVSEGDWTTIKTCDRFRSRKEIVERISELTAATIGVDFALSFPKGFFESLASEKITSHRELSKRIREDLKKNTEDGVRKWIELIGRYRETKTESPEEASARFSNNPLRRDRRRDIPVHERRSLIERFRRIDRILRRMYPDAVASTLGVQYNRLTRRYEFVSANARGRSVLVGLSLIEQIREAKPEIAIWPYDKPKPLTIVEVFPNVFDRDISDPGKLREFFDHEEDNALYVPREVREQVYAHAKAREALFTLLGMIAAERRENKMMRPLRDYRDAFYENEEVKFEGWVYGIGFKELQPKDVIEKQSKVSKPEVAVSEPSGEVVIDESPVTVAE